MSLSRNRSITMNSIVVALRAALRRRCRDLKLRGRRWSLGLRQVRIEAGPDGDRLCPNDAGGLGEVWIVQRPDAHDDLMRTLLRLAEDRRAALRARTPVHGGGR